MTDNTLINLNRRIDHSLLTQEAGSAAIERLCKEAAEYHFHSVCVNPVWVSKAASVLNATDVAVASVTGFPLGAHRTDIKLAEALKAVDDGAAEIDMVANIGRIADNNFIWVGNEITTIRKQLPDSVILKVIVEVGKLSKPQLNSVTETVIDAGAQFIKTSTGFFGGVTVEQVKAIHAVTGNRIKIKASGGIRTPDDCRYLIEAGADRLGTSASVRIMRELAAGQ